MSERARAWWPAAVWAVLILVLTTVPVPASPAPSDVPLDKVIHFVLYLGLGWTLGRGLVMTEGVRVGGYTLGWIGGLAFAALDEIHQAWLPVRAPSFPDWIADAAGLSVGLGLSLLLLARRRERL